MVTKLDRLGRNAMDAMLLVAARGAPGPLDEVRQMPRAAIINHLHTYALAGLEAIGR